MRVSHWILGCSLLLLTGCSTATPPQTSDDVNVAASFYPLAFFAEQIGGEYVHVTQITPGGVEPHDYEPSPADIISVRQSRLFLFNGNGVDAWADKIKSDLDLAAIRTLRMVDVVGGNSNDPHIWLDPVLAEKEVQAMRDTLVQIDPARAETYRANATTLLTNLDQLDHDYRTGLAHCLLNTVIVSHDAFQYVSKRYGFTTLPIAGLSPDQEPAPGTLAHVADIAKQKKIPVIFFETMASPKLSETIANEVGAQTMVLNPIEGLTAEDRKANASYITIMRDNLVELRTAMECN